MHAGFKNVKTACCGLGKLNTETPCSPTAKYCSNREQYVFWDSVHPTQLAHCIFANLKYNRSSPYTFPMNLGKLLHVE
ncbi:SGNH hydrolase-type esterase domain containing protein [Parasponia andersonii]|uniref:SGNH hydrolase-type esterase domain containing protein n=1 Tax=Parasponia andersonii TaxID=3476 RepID=A0A2P5CNU7_PARAD|nr:SGNH hydrolase-type esterase domain containing protein [Parasponia andersonii]